MKRNVTSMVFLLAVSAVAQENPAAIARVSDIGALPPVSASTSSFSSTSNVHAPAAPNEEREMQAEQSQRMLGVMPMFAVTSRRNARPLTADEKLRLWRKGAFDPFQFFDVGFQAALSQAQDQFPSYGQGAAGYGKRFGAALADSQTSAFFSDAAFPVLLHEDPRFFRLGHGSVAHRAGHALLQEFIARKDSGGSTLHFANILGAFSSGTIANAYYPPAERGFALTMNRASVSLLDGSAGGLLTEFWPDLHDKFFHHHVQ